MPTNIHMVAGSRNRKTGPIPVTTSDKGSCPPGCALWDCCYGRYGVLGIHWEQMSNGKMTTEEALDMITRLPFNQLWRHDQAGDLPGRGNRISEHQLKRLVKANRRRRGFTYTHKPVLARPGREPAKYMLENRRLIQWANEEGFRINLSANNLTMADALIDLDIAPVVSIAPMLEDPWWDQWGAHPQRIATPKGRPCIICPESAGQDVQCSTCGICQLPPGRFMGYRSDIILFPAHGTRKAIVSEIAKGTTI